MQEGSAGASGFVDDLLGQNLVIVTVIGILGADGIHQPAPAVADADHLIPFPQGTHRDRADGRIQPRHIPAAGQDSDHSRFLFDWHKSLHDDGMNDPNDYTPTWLRLMRVRPPPGWAPVAPRVAMRRVSRLRSSPFDPARSAFGCSGFHPARTGSGPPKQCQNRSIAPG